MQPSPDYFGLWLGLVIFCRHGFTLVASFQSVHSGVQCRSALAGNPTYYNGLRPMCLSDAVKPLIISPSDQCCTPGGYYHGTFILVKWRAHRILVSWGLSPFLLTYLPLYYPVFLLLFLSSPLQVGPSNVLFMSKTVQLLSSFF